NEELLWPSWRWGPLALFLSPLRFPLALLGCSWGSASWLPAWLTVPTLPWFFPPAHFTWTSACWRSGWRSLCTGLFMLFSTWRFARTHTSRRRARLAVGGLFSFGAATTLPRSCAAW